MLRRTPPLLGLGVMCVAGLAALLTGPRPASAQGLPLVLSPVGASRLEVTAGTAVRLRVELRVGGSPAPGQLVDWRVVSSTAGAHGSSRSNTDTSGISTARFDIPAAGTTRIEALVSGATPVLFTIVSRAVAPPPPPPPPPPNPTVILVPAGPTSFDLVLGDRQTIGVRITTPNGTPVGGVEVEFAVVSSPGSPGVGRSDTTVVSGSGGEALATFGFSTAGTTRIRASIVDPRVSTSSPPIEFLIETASLGALTPERRTWRDAAEALDAICLDVFVDETGQQRPTPDPTPLCVYMTSTLTTREERDQAVRAFTPTGLASEGTTAITGMTQLKSSVVSRLSALRGGALRGAVDQIALEIDGIRLTPDLLASAASPDSRAFARRLEDSFARLYAGLDAEDAPAVVHSVAEPRRENPWGFFASGRLTSGEHASGVETDAFDFDTAGLTAGFDRAMSANGFLGLALTALQNDTDLAGNGGRLEADALAVSAYGIREGAHGYFQAVVTYGETSYDQRRRIPLPIVGDLTARGEFDGDQVGADLELGRSIDGRAGSLTFFARGSWVRASIDGFRETGAVAELPGTGFGSVDFGLAVEEQEIDSLLGTAGVDWGRAFSIPGGLVVPQLTANWWHDFGDDADPARARFLGDVATGGSFLVFGDPPDGDWLAAGVALRFQYLWGSFFVAYDRWFLRDDLELANVNLGLRFEF
ncbi:MAG: autotransporter domain-containing protein [Thermoanaerobaculia bacterium]|nr:autotransporter domain-containing protein [Thermoanaerobaculia bacterium]